MSHQTTWTGPSALPPEALRWSCDLAVFAFETTDDVEPIGGVIGQDAAIDALRFGLESTAPGQNVYVRGLTGTGRSTLVSRLLDEIRPDCPPSPDRIYVHNFKDPTRPRLITLPRGRAHELEKCMNTLIEFMVTQMREALTTEAVRSRMTAIEQTAQERLKQVTGPIEDALSEAGLALVTVTSGPVARPAIFPRIDGQPVPPEVFEREHAKGNVSKEDYERALKAVGDHRELLQTLTVEMQKVMAAHREATLQLLKNEVQLLVRPFLDQIDEQFDCDDVREFTKALEEDLLENRLDEFDGDLEFTVLYMVNPILPHADECCARIVEHLPSHANLVGGIEMPLYLERGEMPTHMAIRGGSLLHADGGYLILEARDVLAEPGAWRALVRTLRTRRLEITPPDHPFLPVTSPLKPEPIPLSVKVVLIGDSELFFMLDAYDRDFSHLFKVLAEFDTVIPHNDENLRRYAGVIKRILDEDGLLPFGRDAVAAVVEHGARIAARADKVTTRFSRIADVVRESSFVARKDGRKLVLADDVRETVVRTKRRASLTSRKFRELLAEGTIQIDTRDVVIGQINALAVIHAGALTYGFPARITASLGPGSRGAISIEREADLSGRIHTKGFHILRGLMNQLLAPEHPLAFEASIAFEQSYGGIDGDSASGAEFICLMSALTRLPLRQDLAITGAIDQKGALQAIGGVNEKIEGFYDTCCDAGLTGTQGVVIPIANQRGLMLRHELVEACRAGRFNIYAVSTIQEAMGLFFGRSPDEIVEAGRKRALALWKAGRRSATPQPDEPEGDDDETPATEAKS